MNKKSNFQSRTSRANHPAGFALMEVLVSILVLTVGLLSVAGLSANSLKASDISAYRATAAREVLSLADVIRSNRQAAVDGAYDVGFGSATVAGRHGVLIEAWKKSLATIPSGDGSIQYVEARDSIVIIARWDESRVGGSSEQKYQIELRI